MSQLVDSFLLSEAEVEQAMILNKCSQDMLYDLLGMAVQTQSLSALTLWLERMQHGGPQQDVLGELRAIGREEGRNLLEALRPVICDVWGYCRRRSSDGLGDPRRLVRLLAPLIGPVLFGEEVMPRDRTLLVVACVFTARSGLSRLCRCGEANRSTAKE
ncbi:MAG TPA: hypothetical protein VFS21_00535 [Roseiflexaceae bacterium]|nr:hypothetical protein [Roseiflexaceae bacterium]